MHVNDLRPRDLPALIDKQVHVYAPACAGVAGSNLHGKIVTVRGVSPTQREVLRTSGGPLQWTRPGLRLTVVTRAD